jgi:hypothetical protein
LAVPPATTGCHWIVTLSNWLGTAILFRIGKGIFVVTPARIPKRLGFARIILKNLFTARTVYNAPGPLPAAPARKAPVRARQSTRARAASKATASDWTADGSSQGRVVHIVSVLDSAITAATKVSNDVARLCLSAGHARPESRQGGTRGNAPPHAARNASDDAPCDMPGRLSAVSFCMLFVCFLSIVLEKSAKVRKRTKAHTAKKPKTHFPS